MADKTLVSATASVAEALADAQDRWWIIGSAAVALLGGDAGQVADVDVITSRRDLDALYAQLPLTDTPDKTKDFSRSTRFGRWSEPPLDIEFMTGLTVRKQGVWHAVEPRTRLEITFGGCSLFLPEREELIAILHLFGREKDLRRAATLIR